MYGEKLCACLQNCGQLLNAYLPRDPPSELPLKLLLLLNTAVVVAGAAGAHAVGAGVAG